jgi:hypothetical protein
MTNNEFIDLLSCSVNMTEGSELETAFAIRSPARTYLFGVSSPDHFFWVNCIKGATARLLAKQEQEGRQSTELMNQKEATNEATQVSSISPLFLSTSRSSPQINSSFSCSFLPYLTGRVDNERRWKCEGRNSSQISRNANARRIFEHRVYGSLLINLQILHNTHRIDGVGLQPIFSGSSS